MKTKRIVFGLIIFTLIFTLFVKNIKNINANELINEEQDINLLNTVSGSMSVTFTEDGKQTINLTENTTYNGWNYNNIGRLNITLTNLDIDVVYKLVITMDSTLYLPVEILPCPVGTLVSFEKNNPISVNGDQIYEGKPFSGTVIYTFNSESSKTVEIDNFELEFKYDEVLWNNLANASLKSSDEPVLSVKLIVEEEILEEKNILDITTEIDGNHSYNAKFNYNNNLSSDNLQCRPSDELRFTISDDSSYHFTEQFFKNLYIEINIPCYTASGTKYYLQYDENDIKIQTKKGIYLDKSLYQLTTTEDKIIVELENFLHTYDVTSLLSVNFTFPQADELLTNPGLYSFKGSAIAYVDKDPNISLFKNAEKFTITLNTNEESQLGVFPAAGSVDYRNDTVVQPLLGFGLKNDGGNSGKIKLVYDFDTNLNDENTILVTTMRLLPDSITKNFEIKYSLIDEDGNLIYFDSSGNVVPEGTPGATQYWSVSVANSRYGKTLTYNSSVLFTRSSLRSDHKIYYFKTIEYVLGELKGGSSLWHPSARFSYSSSTGTIWGYAKFNGAGKVVTSNIKVYEDDNNDIYTLKYDRNVSTNSTKTDENAFGMISGKVSSVSIDAGNTFSISGNITTLSYPYTANNILNTVDNNLILGFRLPEGVTINSSGTKITNHNGSKQINIKSITSESLGDGYNLWIVEIEGGHLIGYCSETLGSIPTGSTIKYDVEFNTSFSTTGSTLYLKDMIFVSAKGINNKADGTYKDMKILDKYDLNQNGKTNDYVGCFSSANNSLSIQIIGKNVTLDIYDNISVNNVAGDELDNNLETNNDIISYELEINCTAGGRAEDFAYYIPIVKKDSVVDNELIFSAEYSYKLVEEVKVSNSIVDNGVKIYYSFDKNLTYSLLNARSVIWYEDIPSDKELKDVTMIKIVAKTGIIENGSISTVNVKMTYDGEKSDYINMVGLENSWASRGQYKYLIGDRGVTGHYSTSQNNLNINYTFDQQVIELTTSTGNHTDNVGNDSEILNITQTFIKDQTFKITSVTTYNALITTVANMEANAHLLAGDEANRTFAFYTTLDTNTKKDISQSNVELGTVLSGKEFNLNFEIFNADVISDITTIRYIEITIESDNGVIIPVRINIKRELTVIGTVTNSISSGKQYTLFGTTETEITISKDSAFTAQFSAENIIPNNYKGRHLVFTNTLPVGSTIVLIDLTNTNNVKYYMYEITSSDTNIIDLTKFNVMGKTTKYTVTTGIEAITEKLLFIIDLPDDNTLPDGTLNSINLARTLNSNVDEMSPEALEFITKDKREYELNATDDIKIGKEIEVEYKVNEIDYSDSKYNDRKLSLSIKPTSTMSVNDSSIEYNGNTYYLNSNNEFIIPLDDVQTPGTYSIKFIYNSKTIEYNEGTCDLNIRLIASATSSAEKPNLGQTLKEVNISLTTSKKPSLKVESMSDRAIENDELKDTVQIKYNAINVTGKVTIELQKKIDGGYTTHSQNLEAVNGSIEQTSGKFTVTGVYTLNLKFNQLMPSGNYQILFTVYDGLGNVERTVAYKFVVVNG